MPEKSRAVQADREGYGVEVRHCSATAAIRTTAAAQPQQLHSKEFALRASALALKQWPPPLRKASLPRLFISRLHSAKFRAT